MCTSHSSGLFDDQKKGNRCNDPVKETKSHCETNLLVTENLFIGKDCPCGGLYMISRVQNWPSIGPNWQNAAQPFVQHRCLVRGSTSLVESGVVPALRHKPTYASSAIRISNVESASNLERANNNRSFAIPIYWGLPPILVADHGHPSHILGHSAPAPHTRRPRPHVSNNSRSPRLLVVMGRHSPCPSGPLARAHPPDPWTAHPLSSISGAPSRNGRCANLSRNRMGTSHMGCHSFQPNLSTRPATSTSTRTLRQRVATQSHV